MKHSLGSENIVLDNTAEYELKKGKRCECGVGKEAGLVCSHELYMYRSGRIPE
jgi:hypothetical protein